MYPVAVVGANVTARTAIHACLRAGFTDITWANAEKISAPIRPALTVSANLSRIITALGHGAKLLEFSHEPDREQVRFAKSGYLLSELPLGKFAQDRYGAAHVNIEAADLETVLDVPADVLVTDDAMSVLEQTHRVVLQCEQGHKNDQATATHELWHAVLALDPEWQNANVTWLGHGATAWQFSTPRNTHFLFSLPRDTVLQADAWPPSLLGAFSAAQSLYTFQPTQNVVREHWYAGNVAYLGAACYQSNVYRREAELLGLEDAWVLSRMLENYEEDVHDGLQQYQNFRRPRTQRVARATLELAKQQEVQSAFGKLARNLNIAFSTRFLPEIAMQRIDWLYKYDCIRGFR